MIGLYDITIIPCKSGGYVGVLKDKPGVMTEADTVDELKEKLKDALRCMIIFEYKMEKDEIKK